ncbi:hypothetical protein [Paenibacillus ihumii]|uniref:hypothetical protein n=1 Tax=Paenibacillus ihumii TaxID=687436 RepID=UPI001CA38454|nr:hypothetical protein [Paenibacillus ihumii]
MSRGYVEGLYVNMLYVEGLHVVGVLYSHSLGGALREKLYVMVVLYTEALYVEVL